MARSGTWSYNPDARASQPIPAIFKLLAPSQIPLLCPPNRILTCIQRICFCSVLDSAPPRCRCNSDSSTDIMLPSVMERVAGQGGHKIITETECGFHVVRGVGEELLGPGLWLFLEDQRGGRACLKMCCSRWGLDGEEGSLSEEWEMGVAPGQGFSTGKGLVAGGGCWNSTGPLSQSPVTLQMGSPVLCLFSTGFLRVFDTPWALWDNSKGLRAHTWLPGMAMSYLFSHRLPASGLARCLLSSASAWVTAWGAQGQGGEWAGLCSPQLHSLQAWSLHRGQDLAGWGRDGEARTALRVSCSVPGPFWAMRLTAPLVFHFHLLQNWQWWVLHCFGPSFPGEQKEISIHWTDIYCTPPICHVLSLWVLVLRAFKVKWLRSLSFGAPSLVPLLIPSPSLDWSARWVNETSYLCKALYPGDGDSWHKPQENLISFLFPADEHSPGLSWGPNLGGPATSSSWRMNRCFSWFFFFFFFLL